MHPNKLWRVNEVQVGYDNQLANEFNLEGQGAPAVYEALPKLNVDRETPYAGLREKMEREKAAAQFSYGEKS